MKNVEKQVNSLISGSMTKGSKRKEVKPVSNPFAQTVTKLSPGGVISAALEILYGKNSTNKEWDVIDRAVLELQVLWGLRISEVIGIQPNDVSPLGQIRIRGKKGSNNRYVIGYQFISVWTGYVKKGNVIEDERSRYYYYHKYVRFGLYSSKKGKENRSVTHAFRHSLVELLQSEGYELSEISGVIGHKNKNNIKYYERKN